MHGIVYDEELFVQQKMDSQQVLFKMKFWKGPGVSVKTPDWTLLDPWLYWDSLSPRPFNPQVCLSIATDYNTYVNNIVWQVNLLCVNFFVNDKDFYKWEH